MAFLIFARPFKDWGGKEFANNSKNQVLANFSEKKVSVNISELPVFTLLDWFSATLSVTREV